MSDNIVPPDFEYEDAEPSDDPKGLAEAQAELCARCKASGIEVKEHAGEKGASYPVLFLPNGRNKRPLAAYDLSCIRSLLSIPFEKYVLLGNYQAICSYSDGRIEANLQYLGRGPGELLLPRRLQSQNDSPPPPPDRYSVNITCDDPNDRRQIRLAPSSDALSVFSSAASLWQYSQRRRMSITIEGLSVSRHDEALASLERIANSFFLQVDLVLGLPFALARHREPRLAASNRLLRNEVPKLRFPQNEFDTSPMALYWYGRSAIGMPLLQYLAYYQAIEYYFPTYSLADARKRVRNILKDPAFRPSRDADLGRLLAAANSSSAHSFGDERAQLRATLYECLDPAHLRDFFSESDERAAFFTAKAKGLTDVKIPLGDAKADLRDAVAERIYDIRCRIVHTKSGSRESDLQLLLPFSNEADQLFMDIELVQYVARAVLIAASSPM